MSGKPGSLTKLLTAFAAGFLCACQNTSNENDSASIAVAETELVAESVQSAAVTQVAVSGQAGNYTFTVTISSPDSGCEQYADWWEVFTPDGTLVYRRILLHSHVNEQPFTRSGAPVAVLPNDEIIVRAHMNNLGYGPRVFSGTINAGLTPQHLGVDVAAELVSAEPLPTQCAF